MYMDRDWPWGGDCWNWARGMSGQDTILFFLIFHIFDIFHNKKFKIKQKYWVWPTKLISQATKKPRIIVCKISSRMPGKFETRWQESMSTSWYNLIHTQSKQGLFLLPELGGEVFAEFRFPSGYRFLSDMPLCQNGNLHAVISTRQDWGQFLMNWDPLDFREFVPEAHSNPVYDQPRCHVIVEPN